MAFREGERPKTEIHKWNGSIKEIIHIRKLDVKAESQVNCSGLIVNRRLVESIQISCQCLLQNYKYDFYGHNGFPVNGTEFLMTGIIANLVESSVDYFQKLNVVERSTYNKKVTEKYTGDWSDLSETAFSASVISLPAK